MCGIRLPAGLENGDRLPAPIYTPAFKAPMGEHDENISFERTVELVGEPRAEELRDLSLEIYERAARTAEAHGLILADTKFEFGLDDAGVHDPRRRGAHERFLAVLGCRDLGVRSRRRPSAWRASTSRSCGIGWPPTGTSRARLPELPDEIVERTAARYRELLERLTS